MTTASPELRKRTNASNATAVSSAPSNGTAGKGRSATTPSTFSVVDMLRLVIGIGLISTLGSYLVTSRTSLIWGLQRPWWTRMDRVQQWMRGPYILTMEELARYDGTDPELPVLLALNRTIYDVSSSRNVYAKGGSYSALTAKDASRAYVTTCFDPVNDLVPYFGGLEDLFVPIWLHRNPTQEDMDEVAKGELMYGLGVRDVMEKIQKRVGRKRTRLLREKYYEEAREAVRQKVKTWEGMFAMKDYPAVGRVVGVDEEDESKWKNLKYCKAARQQRPDMGKSMEEAMKMAGLESEMNIGNMQKKMGKMVEDSAEQKKQDKAERKRQKKEKKKAVEREMRKMREKMGKATEEDKRAAEEEARAEVEDAMKKNPDADAGNLAAAKVEDLMAGGKYGGKAGNNPPTGEKEAEDMKAEVEAEAEVKREATE